MRRIMVLFPLLAIIIFPGTLATFPLHEINIVGGEIVIGVVTVRGTIRVPLFRVVRTGITIHVVLSSIIMMEHTNVHRDWFG